MRDPKFSVTLATLDCVCECGHGKYSRIQTFTAWAKTATKAIEKCENFYAKKNNVDPANVAVIDVRMETGPLEWSGEVTEL